MEIVEKLLLAPDDLKQSFRSWRIEGVFNPAAVRLQNRKILLFARVAERALPYGREGILCPIIVSKGRDRLIFEEIDRSEVLREKDNAVYLKNGSCRLITLSHFRRVILHRNGFDVESIGEKPAFTGNAHEGQFGVEDARITKLSNNYLMTYVSVSLNEGVSTSLAISKDLVHWQRRGIIFREQNKDVVIFSQKINGKYVALHRPEGFFKFSKPSIWISYSPDLVYWDRERSIVQPRDNAWDSEKVGAGTVPIKTGEGWLEIYHAVKKSGSKRIYNAGAVLLDSKNPEKILARSPKDAPLFSPKKDYEREGFVNNVVFPTAAIMDLNGKDLLIYSGAADRAVSVRKISLKDILNYMV